jgi:hypothetical protein
MMPNPFSSSDPTSDNIPEPSKPTKSPSHDDAITWGKKLGSIDDRVMDKLA